MEESAKDLKYLNIEVERVRNAPSNLEDLVCGVCKRIPHPFPLVCSSCSVIICQSCKQDHSKCSITNQPTILAEILPIVKNIYRSLIFKCLHFEEGCKAEVKYEKIESHIEWDCLFVKVKCEGCGGEFKRGEEIETHIQECAQIEIVCENCLVSHRRRDANRHSCIREIRKEFTQIIQLQNTKNEQKFEKFSQQHNKELLQQRKPLEEILKQKEKELKKEMLQNFIFEEK